MVKKKVISLFSGCGGLDLGFEGGFEIHKDCINKDIHPDWIENETSPVLVKLKSTSFETAFANDIKPTAETVWNNYFLNKKKEKKTKIFHLASIVDLVKSAEKGIGPLANLKADVVTGGFPCQDFSLAGKRKGFSSTRNHSGELISEQSVPTEETRGMLYFWMRKVIELTNPKCFVAENVKGLVSMDQVKETIEKDFQSIGKKGFLVVPARVLNAPEFGIPQTRERVIFLGFNKEKMTAKAIKILESKEIPQEYDPYPNRTHYIKGNYKFSKNLFDSSFLKPAPTLASIFQNLGEPPDHPNDPSHLAYSKCKWYGRHCQGQTEIDLNGQGPTIRSEHHGNIEFRRLSSKHGGKHIAELASGLPERRLSVRECAKIQTFPDNMEFVIPEGKEVKKVSGSDAYKLIGNAVPPLLGYHISKRLEHLWPFLFGQK